MSASWLEPTLPPKAAELSPVRQARLLARTRRELLERTYTGTFVYPPGCLLIAWTVGLLEAYPRPVLGLVALLAVIVGARVIMYRRALADTSRPTFAGKAHLVLGVVSAALFSTGLGAAYVARGGDAGVTAGYVAMAAIAASLVMIACSHRRLAIVWVLAAIVPGIAVLLLRNDATARVLIVLFLLYLPVLRNMIVKGYEAWWDAQLAVARLDEQAHELARVSRRAGMAENATNVLHDVGNALNAVKTSADLLARSDELHPTSDLERLVELCARHRDDLPGFIAAEGPKVLRFLEALTTSAREHATRTSAEAARLQGNVLHIEAIVRRQQAVARDTGGCQACPVTDLLDAALGLSRAAHLDVRVEIEEPVRRGAAVAVDRDRALQILVNLLENACDSTEEQGTGRITVRARAEARAVVIEIADEGRGIPREIADRIFTRGFTTKPHGHGFGLHGSFSLAQAMGGALSFESGGLGHGAVFRLRLPAAGALAA
jgi:signal transduction histidine kinase